MRLKLLGFLLYVFFLAAKLTHIVHPHLPFQFFFVLVVVAPATNVLGSGSSQSRTTFFLSFIIPFHFYVFHVFFNKNFEKRFHVTTKSCDLFPCRRLVFYPQICADRFLRKVKKKKKIVYDNKYISYISYTLTNIRQKISPSILPPLLLVFSFFSFFIFHFLSFPFFIFQFSIFHFSFFTFHFSLLPWHQDEQLQI